VDHSIDELLEKGNINDINTTAISGTGYHIQAKKIEVIGVKYTQMTPR
jgi:hypothetical protein